MIGLIPIPSLAAFETNFNLDLNDDGAIGSAYSTIHKAGSVAFQKDSGTGFYAVSVNGGNQLKSPSRRTDP